MVLFFLYFLYISIINQFTYKYQYNINFYYIETMKGNMILVGSDIAYILHDSDEYVQNTLVKEKRSVHRRLACCMRSLEQKMTKPYRKLMPDMAFIWMEYRMVL